MARSSMARRGRNPRTAGIFTLLGSTPHKIAKASAGDTVALGRLDAIATGETISTAKGHTPQLAEVPKAPGVYGFAISVSDRKDEVKLTSAIAKLIEEDPSLSLDHNHDTHEMVLWGQGEMHLRVALERLQGKFGVHARSKPRRIAYKETIRKPVQIRGRHKKQSGGHGQFGDVVVEIAPQPRGSGFRVQRHDHRRRGAEAIYSRRRGRACANGWATARSASRWSISRSIFRMAPTMTSTPPRWPSRRRRASP